MSNLKKFVIFQFQVKKKDVPVVSHYHIIMLYFTIYGFFIMDIL